MNLLIGLLNIAINADNDRAFYLAQKAEVSNNYTNLNFFNIKFNLNSVYRFLKKLNYFICFHIKDVGKLGSLILCNYF